MMKKTIEDYKRAVLVYHADMLVLRAVLSELVPNKERRLILYRENQFKLKQGIIDADQLAEESAEFQKPIFMDMAEKDFRPRQHRS